MAGEEWVSVPRMMTVLDTKADTRIYLTLKKIDSVDNKGK